jgi:hypothetical protein
VWHFLALVAVCAVVFSAVTGGVGRSILAAAAIGFVIVGALGAAVGVGALMWPLRLLARVPGQVRHAWFERNWAQLARGQWASVVQRALGRPQRIDGWGDRTYWSYHVAGRRYVVALDPRRLIHKYSNGLARDLWLPAVHPGRN